MSRRGLYGIFTVLCVSLFFSSYIYGAIPAQERAALIALYNSTDGDNWKNNSGWKTAPLHSDGFAMPGAESDWHGISTANDHVYYIYLYSNNLVGTLPEEFWDLTYLEYVTIAHGKMTGTLSTKIENFERIKRFQLYSNQLSGAIPACIVNLTTLQDLMLGSNQLTGAIPAGLDKLVNLEWFSVVSNKLSGTIPTEIGNMKTLTHLDLGVNQFTGTIPPELGALQNVTFFRLSNNQLTGTIPPELGNMSAVEIFELGNNQLTGIIPPELQQCKNMRSLKLAYNQLTGDFPVWLSTLPNLEYLYLRRNNLTGSLPPELSNCSKLYSVNVGQNQLEGIIPPEYGNLSELENFCAYNNKLTGPIPTEFGKLSKMYSFYVFDNRLSGPIPKELGNWTNLLYFSVSHNQLTGKLPDSLSKWVNIRDAWLNSNLLEGDLPDYLGAWTNIELLHLGCNTFTGPFPSSLCKLGNLKSLTLDNNELTGEIPDCIVNMTALGTGTLKSHINYNGLYTNNPAVQNFLDDLMPGWEDFMAMPPQNPTASPTSPTSVRLSWDLPPNNTITVAFDIYYSTSPDGPYTIAGQTASKTDTFFDVTGLTPGTTYYFMAKTWALHNCKPNSFFSSGPGASPPVTTPTVPGTYSLTVLSSPSAGAPVSVTPADYLGNTNGAAPFSRIYNQGAVVTLTAPAAHDGKPFSKWRIDGADASTSVALQVTMDNNHTVTAVYEAPPPTTYHLTVQSQPAAGVTVTVTPADNNQQTNGATSFVRVYNENTAVTLTAPATYDGKNFSKWQIDGTDASTSSTLQVTMNNNHTVTAVYEAPPPTTFQLTVQSLPAAGVTITLSPADNNQQANGATSFVRAYNEGAAVNLTAPADHNGIPFSKWQIDGVEAATSLVLQVTMDNHHTVTAVYEEEEPPPAGTFKLTVQSNPLSGAAITVTPADNNSQAGGSTSFTRIYDENESVTLSAAAELDGRAFIKWTVDGADKTGNTIQVTMDKNHTAIAIYEENPPEEPRTLQVESTHASGTPITVSPTDLNGDSDGATKFTRSYNKGTSVTLTAPAEHNGHKFDHWTVDGKKITSSTTLNFTISGDHKAKAFYVTPANPGLVVRPVKINFGVVEGEIPPSQIMRVTLNNSPTDWSAEAGDTWLTLSPSSGYGSTEVAVSVTAANLPPGKYKSVITVTAPEADHSPQTVDVVLNVYKADSTAEPIGDFATPVDGSTVYGSIAVTGWVVDDLGVESVKIYREGKNKNDLIYIGDAVFVEGARPDVEALFPEYPENQQAGWGYMLLTNFLPDGGNGAFRLHAIAADNEGNSITLGVKTITCDNANAVKPFGAIDTPGQGGDASGNKFVNWGWVLTPQPAAIPIDGSTITVWVDGVNIGHPAYNIYRSDIANLFPGYANTNGAVGYFYLDTTAYENGVHTIQWLATDDAGHTDGIGSRYFTVNNTVSASRTAQTASIGTVRHRPGRFSRQPLIHYSYHRLLQLPEENPVKLQTIEQERIELTLAGDESVIQAGYMVVGDELRSLPVGSTIDYLGNTFYWQPGPGFLGHYPLLFILKEPGKQLTKKWVHIRIKPQY
jgi:Leucine-rich repeat (LRR) protein